MKTRLLRFDMNSLVVRLTAAVVFISCLTLCVAAQSGGALSGKVTDQNGAVIVDAEVKALSFASGGELVTKTGAYGIYELWGLQPGSYQISVSSKGFARTTRALTLQRPVSVTEDFVLLPGAIESTVTVTAGKGSARDATDTPQTVTVSDRQQIEERRPASTLQAVEKAPNLTPITSNPALERPRLRGLDSNRLLILLDGERLNNMRSDPTTGVSPSIVDVTQLESAEVLNGAGSSLYGSDALGGIINLITSTPARPEQAQHLGLRFDGGLRTNGLFPRGAATLNWSASRAALRLSGSLFRIDDYRSGNRAISLEEVVRLGRLATAMGNASGSSVTRTFAVWSLPARAEISNGQAKGFNDQLDLWFFPGESQSVRYRQFNSQHTDLGFPFIAPPYDQRTQFNGFRRLDKYGLRYEGREFKSWLRRLAAGFYWQKYSFADDTVTSPIVFGSSWEFAPVADASESPLEVLTGRPSTFTSANFTDNKNSVSTLSFEAQATFAPTAQTIITTGIGYLRDSSVDQFSRVDLASCASSCAPQNIIVGRASNPDSVYQNRGWFNLFEYEPGRRLRLTGGLRVDNWKTAARVTRGFPLGVETAILKASLPELIAHPGPVDVEGTGGIIDLLDGANGIETSRTVVTGNAGAVIRLPRGINPYFRWSSSYREPGITERYLLRDFGDPSFSVLVVPNVRLKPERGSSFDFGVKVRRDRLSATLGYFTTSLKDFIRAVFADPLFIPAEPGHGLEPISPFFPFHGVLYIQRANTARARISGLEASYETNLSLKRAGNLTLYGTLGYLKGTNLTPDETTLTLIRQFYNRADTPIPLRGSVDDVPLSGITPLRAINSIRFDSSGRSWFVEYEVRYQARVKRVDPLDLTTTISTQYGTLASLNSFTRQTARAGYTYSREDYRMSLTLGVENLTDRLYFENFQTAPAPGRAVVFGLTFELFNLLRR